MQWQRYILAFFITAAIFATAFYIANYIDNRRIADIREIQEAISIDLLSSETQFELLGSLDCSLLGAHPVLSEELNSLAERLSYTENNLGSDNEQVLLLKKQYSLLQIKDYLLMQEISRKCGTNSVSILYFYSNEEGSCENCGRMGEVLTYLRQTYPDLRVYSFDYNLNLGALETLIALRKIKPQLPALIINNRAPEYGFKNLEQMEVLVPELKDLATSTSSTQE